MSFLSGMLKPGGRTKMKTYKGMPWSEFTAFLGNAVREELERQAPAIANMTGLTGLQTGYGRFGSLEANYTLKEGKGLLGKLIGQKIFTIHDNSAEGVKPSITIHDPGYFWQKSAAIFRTMGKNLGLDFQVEYA